MTAKQDRQDFADLLRQSDKPVTVAPRSLACGIIERKQNRSTTIKRLAGSAMITAGIAAIALLTTQQFRTYDVSTARGEAGTPNQTKSVPLISQYQNVESNFAKLNIESPEAASELIQSRKRIKQLHAQVAELQKIRRRQQHILLKEKLSRTEIDLQQIAAFRF